MLFLEPRTILIPCPCPLLPKDRIEGFVINRIRDYILTEENLNELVRMTNEELVLASSENRKRLELLKDQIAEIDSRSGRFYDALETGHFEDKELAPRIRALANKKEELQQSKAEVEETLCHETISIADNQAVRGYVDDLKNLLTESSITEQRSFLKSFVDRIEVDDSEVKMYYTIPMPPRGVSDDTVGVLSFVHHG